VHCVHGHQFIMIYFIYYTIWKCALGVQKQLRNICWFFIIAVRVHKGQIWSLFEFLKYRFLIVFHDELLIFDVYWSIVIWINLKFLIKGWDAVNWRRKSLLAHDIFKKYFLILFFIFHNTCSKIIGIKFAFANFKLIIHFLKLVHHLSVPSKLKVLLFLSLWFRFHIA